jgi:aspartyl/glutamyl-tRNA(Asn/Gln) amidotransferase C subunit
MPRLPRVNFTIRTELTGPRTSPEREKFLKLVKKIDIVPEIQDLLAKPTWAVASLLPPSARPRRDAFQRRTAEEEEEFKLATQQEDDSAKEITREKLHHLLKLSALPRPKDEREEKSMLADLRSQVHFVKEIQKVDTTGVEPLVAIRDETAEAREENTFTKASLAEFIALEEKKGSHGTIRRRKDTFQVTSYTTDGGNEEDVPPAWAKVENPFDLGTGGELRRMGKFFMVKKTKKDSSAPKAADIVAP